MGGSRNSGFETPCFFFQSDEKRVAHHADGEDAQETTDTKANVSQAGDAGGEAVLGRKYHGECGEHEIHVTEYDGEISIFS